MIRRARSTLTLLLCLTGLAPLRSEETSITHETKTGRSSLGIAVAGVPEDLAHHLELRRGEGVWIGRVLPHRSGEFSGLKKHDVITHIDGHRVLLQDFPEVVRTTPAGVTLTLRVLRRMRPRCVEVIVERLSSPEFLVAKPRRRGAAKEARLRGPLMTCGQTKPNDEGAKEKLKRKKRELRREMRKLSTRRRQLTREIARLRAEQRSYRHQTRGIESELEELEDPNRRLLLSRRIVGLMTLVSRLEQRCAQLQENGKELLKERAKIARIIEYHLRPPRVPSLMT